MGAPIIKGPPFLKGWNSQHFPGWNLVNLGGFNVGISQANAQAPGQPVVCGKMRRTARQE